LHRFCCENHEPNLKHEIVPTTKELNDVLIDFISDIKFIGELFKGRMLPEKIMHECIRVLLKDQENPSEYDIESLCKLIKTIGKGLDTAEPRAKAAMDQYFEIMTAMSNNTKLPSRLRFMLKVCVHSCNNKISLELYVVSEGVISLKSAKFYMCEKNEPTQQKNSP
jgi:hypothetical protein